MEILRLQMLGGVRLSQGSRLLSDELSKKAQALLCHLAVSGRPHSRDVLAGLLWSDFPDHRARANLRDTLSDLHRVLPHHLAIDQSRIAFIDDPSKTWLDIAVFQIHIRQAQQSLRKTPSPSMLPADLIIRMEEAMNLYQGDFMDGFYVRRAALFEEWLAGWQERVRQMAVEALQILAAHYTGNGDYMAGLTHANRLLELDPWREEGHRQLMRLLALSGQQSAALKQFEVCRQILLDELSLEPAAETETLHEAIRAGEVQPQSVDTRGYELLELIGEGQMSAVYKAFQPTVRREVAIKIVHAESMDDPTFLDRFETIAQTVAGLEFPWIVPLYDFWREAGAAYMIMRLLKGANLKESLANGPWSPETAVRLIEQVAAALAAAHEAGIVHGNLKPANILLDEAGNAYLSDFGMAAGVLLDPASRTVGYLSPEQRLGEPASARSDVYALGLISYELLSGTLKSEEGVASDSNVTVPHLAALSGLGEDLSVNLDAVLHRATATRPAERFADVLAMTSALRSAVKRDPYERLPAAAGFFQRQGSQLPLDETPFIGRKDELFMLDKLLADPAVRVINVTGPGGIGKTRLALAAARMQLDKVRHGVYFVPLAAVDSADHIVSTIAATLELPVQDESSPKRQLFDYLQNKHLLLILDNFEHLVDGKVLLTEMIGSAPQLSILITSREVLHLREEQLFPLAGLTLPESESAERVFEADAPKLFLQSARRLQPDFTLYESDLGPLDLICRLVEGMPLAIELAAGWANKIALTQIAAQLRRSLKLLQTEDRILPERHSNIQAVFATSWEQLSEQDQQVFKNLSVFRGGFALDAARQICDISFGSLSRLVAKSLLQYERGSDRYQMHELLRQFAAMQLARDKQEESAVIAKHASYYCRLLSEMEGDLKGSRQDAALLEIETNLGNIRKAWQTAAENDFINLIELAIDSLSIYYRYRFLPDKFVSACQVAVQHLQKLAAGTEATVQARRALARVTAMQATPYVHVTLGSEYLATKESLNALEQSRNDLQELAAAGEDTRKEQAFVFMRLGALLLNIELTHSTPILEESLALYQQLGDRWGQSEALLYLSSAKLRLHDYHVAKPLWEESLAIKRLEGDRRGLADSLTMLGMRAASHNETADTLQYAREGYDTNIRIRDRASLAEAHWNYGVLMAWTGQYTEARRSLIKAETIYLDLGLNPPALILGNVLAMLGEYDAVVEYVEMFISRTGDRDDKPNEARAYHWLGYVALAQRNYPEAQRLCLKSIAAYEACGLKANAGMVYGLLALAARGMGNLETPWFYQEKGLRIQQDGSQLGPLGIWLCTPITAILLVDSGHLKEAVSAYAFATNHPMIANSVWFDEMAGSFVRTAESELPTEIVEKARKRGQSGDPLAIGAKLLELVSKIAKEKSY